MLRIFIQTDFEGGRHARRVEKITRFEQDQGGGKGKKA
jgi:ribose 5-phosphate isomerase RpiB